MPDEFAVITYRYLRIAMAATVATLGVSILIERSLVDCWQTSVSGYYYTPVRAIFVSGLVVLGVGLIVIQGNRWEDIWFNLAGILAPAVAVLPTADVGGCWSVDPAATPRMADGTLAPWVTANIDNNTKTLLIAGALGLVIAALGAMVMGRSPMAVVSTGSRATRLGLLAAGGLLVLFAALYRWWDGFSTRAHAFAAVAMFVFIGCGILSTALQRWRYPDRQGYARFYFCIVALMVAAGLLLFIPVEGWQHRVLIVEAIEAALLLGFWLVQTYEHWDQAVISDVDGRADRTDPGTDR